MNKDRLLFVKLLFFFGGLYIATCGEVFLIESGLGVDPWTMLNIGLSHHTPLTVGQASQAIGIIMILVSWALKVKPQIGTFLNMYVFGLFLDLNISLNNAYNIV